MADHAQAKDDRGSSVSDSGALVHSITIHPRAPQNGFEVEVKGKLAVLIGGEAFPQGKYRAGRMVAEDRYITRPTMESALFCFWRQAA